MLLANHSWWHSWGETTLWIAAIVTAMGIIWRARPIRWMWAQLVTKPVTSWGTQVVTSVVETKVTSPNGGSSLRDQVDTLSGNQDEIKKSLDNLHECFDRRFTATHAQMEKLSEMAEEVLSEAVGARQRIRQLYSALDAAVFECSETGFCTYVNPAYSRLTGLVGTDALGEGWMAAVHADDRERVASEWRRAVDEEKNSMTVVYRIRNLNTSNVVEVRGVAQPLHDAKEKVIGWIGMIEPIGLWSNLGGAVQEDHNA
jgi:PAS domain S-box-containing protein